MTAKIIETVFIDEAGFDAALAVFRLSSQFINGQLELGVGGQQICPMVATRPAR
ncbi:hypothetical protein [Cryobacterium algoricola]|uniref:hypothetical protein n=1 Tax=Cryobacterium algoricola TaxID=1259183 RepID=UPI00141A9AB6|nr:hypothetical protein [Cryobacterium algoricola]